MAILVNDLYNINNEIVSLEFNQHTKLKLHYQPSSSSHTIKWKLIKTPFSIGNPMMEYVFQESGSAESQEQTEYLLLDIQGSYKIEIEEDTGTGFKNIYTLAIQVNGLKNKSSAPFPGETTEIDNVDGYMRKIEQATQRLTEESGSFSVIGVLDPDETPLELGETVVIKENEFIESIIPAGHTWELERANLTTQENALVGIVIERNTFERYDGDPSETFYRVGFLGQFNIPTSLPDPLESLGDSGGSFYYDPTSKLVEVDYSPTRFHWGRYITVEPTYDVSGYNVIVIESLMKLIPEGGLSSDFLTSFTLEFDRHDGDGDIKWEADTSSPDTTKYEISFFHGLQSNNLLVEVWKEPNEQSIYEEWVRVDIDEIIKEDENNMTLRITELDPNPDPTSDFKGRINIIKLDDSKEFKPGGLVWVGNILKTNWEEDSVEGDYFQKFKHNMNNFDLFVEIWDNNGVSKIRTVKDIIKENSNEIIIRVATSEDTFGGRLLLSTYLSGATKTFISLFDTPNSYVSAGQIPRVNSSLTGLEWADDVGLWKYKSGATDKTLIPKESDVIWIGYLNESKFRGTEFYAKVLMESDLFKGKRVEFISQPSAISENDSVYLFDNGAEENEDDINAYSLKFMGKDGNAHSILTMRQKVEDLSDGPIDHKHWATTEAIKSYVDTMTSLNTFIGLTDTFQETPDSYGNNNLLVTKTDGVDGVDGVYEEPSLKFYYDGDTYDSTGKFLRIKDATLRLGNHDYDDDGNDTKDWLINLLNVKDDLAYHSGSGAKHQEKIFRHYSLMSSASLREAKFISQLRIEDIYANSTHPSKILGDLTWSLRTEGQIGATSQFSEIKLISNIDRVEIEMRNSGSGNDSRNKISSLSSGAFLIEKYTASNTWQSIIEMDTELKFFASSNTMRLRDIDTLWVHTDEVFTIQKRPKGVTPEDPESSIALSSNSIITDGSRVHKIRRVRVSWWGFIMLPVFVLPDDDILILYRSWCGGGSMPKIPEIRLDPDNRIHGRKITIINNIYNNVDDKSTAIVAGWGPPDGPPHHDYLFPPIKISSINVDSSGAQNICGHFNLFKWLPDSNDTIPTLVFLDALNNPATIRTNKASSFYLMNLSSVTLIWDDSLDKWMIHNHHGFLGFYSDWTPQF